MLVALAVGGIIGLINGWLVSFRGLEPFIVTLGMLALARGLVYAYSEGIPITPQASDTFAQIGQTTVLGIPVLTLIWIAMVVIVAFLLRRTVWGRRVYAIGSNKEAARSSGIPVRATLWSVYILGGLLVGLGGWMFVCRFGSATALAGNLMELEAIAAVVIGGAALSGGRGTVFGAVVGTIIFQVIANLLSLLNVSTFLQDAFRGALILVAVTLATVQFARKRSPSTQPRTTSRRFPAHPRPASTPAWPTTSSRRPRTRTATRSRTASRTSRPGRRSAPPLASCPARRLRVPTPAS